MMNIKLSKHRPVYYSVTLEWYLVFLVGFWYPKENRKKNKEISVDLGNYIIHRPTSTLVRVKGVDMNNYGK